LLPKLDISIASDNDGGTCDFMVLIIVIIGLLNPEFAVLISYYVFIVAFGKHGLQKFLNINASTASEFTEGSSGS
jgi:hypothetical protein